MIKRCLFFICSSLSLLISLHAENSAPPESQIIVIENFIPPDLSHELIQFFDREKKELNSYTDNQLTFSATTDPHIRAVISSISREILQIMEQSYSLNNKKYHVDHCALYARIEGNTCSYHADNVYFDCPIHGKDQNTLRRTCNGTCLGARFVPNHTGWREYTALLYLNDDFEGGEILFEDGPFNRLYRKVIPIKANMLVITPNNKNFYHEVFRIRKGKRYSLHFWYTSNPQYRNIYVN